MINKRRVCVVITARPSYSRVKSLLVSLQNRPDIDLQIVVTASALLDRYGSAVNYIEKDGFRISARAFSVLEGENLTSAAKTTGIGILELSTVFENLSPEIVVTIADRFETIATAVTASFMNIPLAHIQGGEVTGNIDEKVRHSITKLADYHFVASESAKERVIKLGEEKHYVYNTGCPSIDLAAEILKSPQLDFDPYVKYGGVGKKPEISGGYIVVMQHPVTNEYEQSRNQIEETLKAISSFNYPTLWFWPNVDAGSDGTSSGIRAFREFNKLEHVHFFKNMEPNDFLKLVINSKCLVGNSSVGIRECAYLAVPVVNVGTRQNKRERGSNVIDVDYSESQIKEGIVKWFNVNKPPEKSSVYGGGNAGELIAEVLATVPLKFHKTITY